MSSLIINNANIITPTEVICGGSVIIENGVILDINSYSRSIELSDIPVIDAAGKYLAPGIIDIHTDAMDSEINPRPNANFPIHIAFRELEKKMVSAGITTVYHSLHLGYKDAELNSKSKLRREDVFAEVYKNCLSSKLIHHKIHLRYELTGVDDYLMCFDLIKKSYISLFSFMDHTPGQGQYPLERFLKNMRMRGIPDEIALAEIKKKADRPKISNDQLNELIRFALEQNIPIASHDDDSVEKVKTNHQLGVNICEFPINMETAKEAHELKMAVVGGASNILRGGSTSGNLAVEDAVKEGYIDTLCSDYYPASLLYSAFILFEKNILTLSDAFNLISLNPAKAAQIDAITGSIEKGKQADLILIDYKNKLPEIVAAITSGNVVNEYRYIHNKQKEYASF